MSDDIPVRDVPPDDGEPDHGAPRGEDTPPPRPQGPADDPLADLRALTEGARTLATLVNERFVAPLVRGYPEVADHLAAAGAELAAVFRTVLRGQEEQWHAEPDPERITIAPTESTAPEPVDDDDSGEDDE
jgi:hypothetical protein